MRIIGLTGGIACGKSTISATLAELGAIIIDGDALARELTVPNGVALPAIRQAFGDSVFLADGTLNRRALGQIVFSDKSALEQLDALMQPLLLEMITAGVDAARQAGAIACVLDMPLLYEKNLDRLCDRVWCAWLPEDVQLERLIARDGFTREEALNRIHSQMPTDEKAARADIVIDTSGPIQYTKDCIRTLYAQETGSAPR